MRSFRDWMNFREAVVPQYGYMKVSGWLVPGGNFIQANAYEHVEVVAETPVLKKYLPWWDEEWKKVKAEEDNSEISGIEWHNYDMALDDFRSLVVKGLYAAGCLRVGSINERMYFEGTPDGIKGLYQHAKDMAESHGMEAKFEPRRV